ncbi:MAG TPA: hypothetical protein VKV39_05465 [Candidatus Sulfotelmatobacter sp.]|nr:hypothetical protein [Candidatus Sulfotelmatobacter sp.]
MDRARLVDALTELHHLLEEYAPSWYTQQHHAKTELALRAGRHEDGSAGRLGHYPKPRLG